MRIQLITGLCILVLLQGCGGGKEMVNRYYLIEMPDPAAMPSFDEMPHLNGHCEIARVDVAPVYENNQIINRSDSHEITRYKYHLWAERPSVSVRTYMLGLFRKAAIFDEVSDRFGMSIPEYRFHTRVESLEVLDEKNAFSAHVKVIFILNTNPEEETVLFHEADRIVPLTKKDLNLFAGAVSQIFLDEFRVFAMKLKDREDAEPGQ